MAEPKKIGMIILGIMFTLVLLSGIWEMWSVYQFESRPTNIEREAAKWLRNMERERERENRKT